MKTFKRILTHPFYIAFNIAMFIINLASYFLYEDSWGLWFALILALSNIPNFYIYFTEKTNEIQ